MKTGQIDLICAKCKEELCKGKTLERNRRFNEAVQ